MAKPRNRVFDYGVYLVIRIVGAFLRTLPFALAFRVADGLAWVLMRISRSRIDIARDNLRQAFPGRYSEAELGRLVAETYRHFCRVIVEVLHIEHVMRTDNWRDFLSFGTDDQCRDVIAALVSGRSVMMVTGHFGNWEIAGYVLALLGFRGCAIARPLDNSHLDRWLRRWREATGQKLIAKNGEFELIEKTLQNGGILATLGDQDAGQRGLFVPFFNRPASTHKAVALLALEHKPIMVVVGAARIGVGMSYCLYIEDIIDPLDYEKRPDAVKAITVRFTEALERMIRRHPEQYLWIHRRWKHQPPAKKKAA